MGTVIRAVVLPLLMAPLAVPAAAQLEAALDAGYTHGYVWRGLTRVSRPAVQPALVLGWKTPDLLLSAGGWALLEPWRPRPGDLTMAGENTRLAELDAWVQADYRWRTPLAAIEARAGLIRYTFHGDELSGGLAADRNTSELYAGLKLAGLRGYRAVNRPPHEFPVGFEATAAFDLGDTGGTWLEAGLVADLPLLFIGEPLGALGLRLTGAWSWDQEAGAPDGGYYAGEGFTHATLAAGVSPYFHVGPVPATLHLGGTVQYGVDEATRVRGTDPGDRSRWTAWMDVTVSLLYPLRRTQ